MKIGPLDVGVKTLALSASLVVVAMLDIRLAVSGHTKRIEGFYSSRIPQGLVGGMQREFENGLKQSEYLLKISPGHVAARLYRATFLYNLKNYDAAKEAFQAVASDNSASPEHRALGALGVGAVGVERSTDEKRAEAGAEASEHFLKALKLAPDLADARVALCEAVEWRLLQVTGKESTPEGKAGLNEARDWLLQVLQQEAGKEPVTEALIAGLMLQVLDGVEKAKHPPGLVGMAQFYNIRGIALTRAKKAVEAEQAFDAAQWISPNWNVPVLNQWRAMIKLLPEAELKLSTREELLAKYAAKVSSYPNDAVAANSAFALAWYRTREAAPLDDWVMRGYSNSLELLKQNYTTRGDAQSLLIAVTILDERLFGTAARPGLLATLSREFFLPVATENRSNYWKEGAVNGPGDRTDNSRLLNPIIQTATTMQGVLADCLKRVRLEAKQTIEMRLRMLACELIVVLATEDENKRTLHGKLVQDAQELKGQASDNPDVLRAYAWFMLRSKDYVEAGKALRRASELGAKSEELTKILETVSAQPKLVRPRPDQSGWFGVRPLIGATLWAPRSPGAMAAGEMSFDGQNVAARIIGSQILYLLPEGRLTDGKHTVKMNALDGYGNKAELECAFVVDKVPPQVVTDPAPGSEMAGPLPVWTIKLSDQGVGVDVTSVQIRMNNVGSGSTPCRTALVEGGNYAVDMPSLGVKRGERVTVESFKVVSMISLTPGQYELHISLADLAGNKKDQSWTYQVK